MLAQCPRFGTLRQLMVQRAKSRLGADAPAVGFLVDLIEDGYQTAIAAGVLKAAKDAGATVHCFVGGVLGSPDRSAPQRNHVYALASPATVDALVILGGTLVNHVGPEALARYFNRCRPMPMCSVAMPLDGMGSVLIDNKVGMRSAIDHLINVHNHRRIAFVRGPLANAEAELRFQIYRDVLTHHGLPLDERMVAVGNFQSESGRVAVVHLLDEQHLRVEDIDAIVVSNDNMAFGVLQELAARKIRVPSDVAVTGFDDVEEARYTSPGLTTVRQPLEEQGREAVRMVIAALQCQTAPGALLLTPSNGQRTMPTELIVRGSCGCSTAVEHQSSFAGDGMLLGFEASLMSQRQHVIAELARSARGTMTHAGPNWEARLVSTIADELHGGAPGSAIKSFEGLVQGLIERGIDIAYGHAVLDCLRRELLLCLRKEPDRRAAAEDLFQNIRLAIGRTAERVLGASRLRAEQWARQLSVVGARLIGTFDVGDLRAAVEDNFPLLGFVSCFVVLYEGEEIPAKYSKLVLAYDSSLANQLPTPLQFLTENLLPAQVTESMHELCHCVVAPLFFKEEVFGYLVVEFNLNQSFAYEAVRNMISAALKGAMLVQDVRRQHGELDSALSLIGDTETRHAECLGRIELVMNEVANGSLTDPQEIFRRVTKIVSAST
jgi:phosphoserine phosphatase RsbU/P